MDRNPDTLPVLEGLPLIEIHDKNVSGEITLPKVSMPNLLIYEYIGYGKFLGAWLKFNSDDVLLTFEFDNQNSFTDLDLEFIDHFSHDNNNINSFGFLKFNKDDSLLGIEYPSPKSFNRSFRVYARCHKDSDKHKLESYMIQIIKES